MECILCNKSLKKIFSFFIVMLLVVSILFSSLHTVYADDEDDSEVGLVVLTLVAEAPQAINQAIGMVNQVAPVVDHFIHNECVERVVNSAISGAAGGAATGAISGAAAGGVGAIPCAIGGAVLGAVGGAVNGLLRN